MSVKLLVIVPTLCAAFMKLDHEPAAPLRPAARWTMAGVAVLFLLFIRFVPMIPMSEIKVLLPELARDPEMAARFLREARAMARVDRP